MDRCVRADKVFGEACSGGGEGGRDEGVEADDGDEGSGGGGV